MLRVWLVWCDERCADITDCGTVDACTHGNSHPAEYNNRCSSVVHAYHISTNPACVDNIAFTHHSTADPPPYRATGPSADALPHGRNTSAVCATNTTTYHQSTNGASHEIPNSKTTSFEYVCPNT